MINQNKKYLHNIDLFNEFIGDLYIKTKPEIENKWGISHSSIKRWRKKNPDQLSIFKQSTFGTIGTQFVTGMSVANQYPKNSTPFGNCSNNFNSNQCKNESVSKKRISTLAELLEHCKVDSTEWEVVKWTLKKWDFGIKNSEDAVEVEEFFAVSAVFKKRVEIIQGKQILNELAEELKALSPKVSPFYYNKENFTEKRLLEISPFDLHFNKLCWEEETGENYDSVEATKRYETAISDLVNKAVATGPIDRILFIIGQDLFNIDSNSNTTTGGTPQTADSRHHKIFRKVLHMKIDTIRRLSLYAPVDVLIVPGNHDEETTSYLGMALEVAFTNDANIDINPSAKLRKYYQYGKVMLCFTHGDKEKLTDLPLITAVEEPYMFGATKYREVHTGHKHTTKAFGRVDVDEQHGVRVRILPSLTATDAWHKGKGFVGNIQACEAYIWDAEKGLDTILIHNI